jgi:hypothetical protein
MENSDKSRLLLNLDKLHTTDLGIMRIKKNLSLDVDNVVKWCREKIQNPNAFIIRKGKNWYVNADNCEITVNAYSYTIIAAHMFGGIHSMKKKRNGIRAIALVITALLGTGLLSGCGFNTSSVTSGGMGVVSKQTGSSLFNRKGNSDTSSAISNPAPSKGTEQDDTATFMKIEPTILKTTQNTTYTYAEGKLTFTIGSDSADFPSKCVSSIFNPHVDFMPSSIFVSANKIAVV